MSNWSLCAPTSAPSPDFSVQSRVTATYEVPPDEDYVEIDERIQLDMRATEPITPTTEPISPTEPVFSPRTVDPPPESPKKKQSRRRSKEIVALIRSKSGRIVHTFLHRTKMKTLPTPQSQKL